MQGSYQFEQLEGRHTEAAMLAERAQMRLADFPELLRRHGMRDDTHILDIGCGQGIRSRVMAETFPQARVVGVDRSEELIQAHQDQSAVPNLHFAMGNIYSLPFSDQTFDFVYVRLVFMHLTDPHLALKEIRRVLKPAGRVLIEDADRDAMFFEPQPPRFARYWQLVQEGQRRLGGDPNVGRKLATYLMQHDFQNLNVEVQPITGAGDDIAFLARTLMPSLSCYLPAEERAFAADAVEELYQLAAREDARFYHYWYVVSGAA